MEIKIEDLGIGDEIIMGTNSQLKYLKILELPRLSKKRVGWRTKKPLYVNILCSTKYIDTSYTYTGWRGKQQTYKSKRYICEPNNHNEQKRINLNERTLWLIKKNDLL